MYTWLKKHGWLVALTATVVGACAGVIALFIDNGSYETVSEKRGSGRELTLDATPDGAEGYSSADDDDAVRKNDFIRQSYPGLKSFKFVTYEAGVTTADGLSSKWPGYISLFESNGTSIRKMEEVPCSYPDGFEVVESYEEGYIVATCDVPSWVSKELYNRDDWVQNYIYIYIIFFDRGRVIKETLVGQEGMMYVTDIIADLEDYSVDLVMVSFNTEIWSDTLIERPLELNAGGPMDKAYRVRLSFDKDWVFKSLKKIPIGD